MATRSFIATKENDSFNGIYCHWDGYPEYMLNTLTDNYNNKEKVDSLIEMGDASIINDSLETSEFYHRDRKEKLKSNKGLSIEDLYETAKNVGCEYLYVFVCNKWMVHAI